jgi:dienelactone hydrolase
VSVVKKTLKRIILGFLFVFVVGASYYLLTYTHATDEALTFLESSELVTVSKKQGYYLFEPLDEIGKENMVIYAGGKVSHLAYARLAHELAKSGFTVYLPEMLFSLAFFSSDVALDFVRLNPENNWYVVGHSLGGVAMSSMLAKHDIFRGAIYLGSYPFADLKASNVYTLILYAQNDGLTSVEDIEAALPKINLDAFKYVIIPGGNHANFGDYGPQAGDGLAMISSEEQISFVVSTIVETFIE